MATEMLPERCVEHRVTETEVLGRLKVLEDDVKDLYAQLKDKVDSGTLKDLMERNSREIEELRKAILRLSTADIKHSEALAGIHQLLLGFKETQDLMRNDYCRLTECYTQTSVHIASITAILAERAKKEESNIPKIEVSTSNDPWYIRLATKNKAVSYVIFAVVATIIWVVIAKFDDLVRLLGDIFGK